MCGGGHADRKGPQIVGRSRKMTTVCSSGVGCHPLNP